MHAEIAVEQATAPTPTPSSSASTSTSRSQLGGSETFAPRVGRVRQIDRLEADEDHPSEWLHERGAPVLQGRCCNTHCSDPGFVFHGNP